MDGGLLFPFLVARLEMMWDSTGYKFGVYRTKIVWVCPIICTIIKRFMYIMAVCVQTLLEHTTYIYSKLKLPDKNSI